MWSLGAACNDMFSWAQYLSIFLSCLLEGGSNTCFPTQTYLRNVHLSDCSSKHSLPEMIWWLQVVLLPLCHIQLEMVFHLVLTANHELNIPWIHVVYTITMNVCWFLSWVQFGYVWGWGVLFESQKSICIDAWPIMLCYVMLCYVMWCYVMWCYVKWCYVM